MTKDDLVALRETMERAQKTVEQMGMTDTTRWTIEKRVEMDIAYMRAKADAETARRAYYAAVAGHAVTEHVTGRVVH